MKDEFFEKMFSYKALFQRAFMECNDCGFVFTTLGQANFDMEGLCPSCGDNNLEYASEQSRKKFIEGVKDELSVFEKEAATSPYEDIHWLIEQAEKAERQSKTIADQNDMIDLYQEKKEQLEAENERLRNTVKYMKMMAMQQGGNVLKGGGE